MWPVTGKRMIHATKGTTMSVGREARLTRRRGLLLAVAALLAASALIAVAILLFGTSGSLEGRILRTTALLAGYGLLALPVTILLDQGRGRGLAPIIVALAGVGAVLALIVNWTSDPPQTLGKAAGTVAVVAVATAQVSAMVAGGRMSDPTIVRRLFVVSTILAGVVAGMVAFMVWAEVGGDVAGRILVALIVLDASSAALHPLLARARAASVEAHLQIMVTPGGLKDVTVGGRDLASAVATAIRGIEADGRRVRSVEMLEDAGTHAPEPAAPGARRTRHSPRLAQPKEM
jgi:hypothetical protein